MIVPTPRVIDDDEKHLAGLTRGLNRLKMACLPVRFSAEPDEIPPCPHVRIVFADLHLIPGNEADRKAARLATIGSLITDSIKPSGPYIVVVWTAYPEEAEDLESFLDQRLDAAVKPLAIARLDKADHIDGEDEVRDVTALAGAIRQILADEPHIAALLDWESRISGASADTVTSILQLAQSAGQRAPLVKDGIGELLARLATAAAGEHVERDRFRAVNEALLPILADRISSLRSEEADSADWQAALGAVASEPAQEQVAKLNRLLHIEVAAGTGTDRGAVIELPERFSGGSFSSTFGLEQEVAACRQFKHTENGSEFRWVLVQAACDHAWPRPGPVPFHLGLLLSADRVEKRGKPPAALWTSPCFEFHERPHFLHVNARFPVSLPKDMVTIRPLFRVREQLLDNLLFAVHSHGTRPGIISL